MLLTTLCLAIDKPRRLQHNKIKGGASPIPLHIISLVYLLPSPLDCNKPPSARLAEMSDSESTSSVDVVSDAPTVASSSEIPAAHVQHDSQASLANAIANFRPTSREVISGIAPHVFDERRQRRRRSIRRHESTKTKKVRLARGESQSSPLRVSAVISLDGEDPAIFMSEF